MLWVGFSRLIGGMVETSESVVVVNPAGVSAADVVAVAREDFPVEVSADSLAKLQAGRDTIVGLASDVKPHYGVSTGFGALATEHIEPAKRMDLQVKLVRSHAAGMGPLVEREVVRALMLLRLATLCSGHTGVRPVVAETYAAVLNAGITPAVHEYGSLGCSGDLAPLAHCALVLMGEGNVVNDAGQVVPAGPVLAAAGIEPIQLQEKEGLALINGTDGMLGMLVLALADLDMLLDMADVSAALSIEGLLGTDAVFAPQIHALRPHAGQGRSAANLRALLADSPIVASHSDRETCPLVQDAYSLRCTPSVHGAARDTAAHARAVAEAELAAAVDNPVVVDGEVRSNGNFHGAPVAYVLDFLAIALADVASMSERRTDRFLDPARNNGLPAFLAGDPGVDSGFMIAQYTAAGMVSEMKRLATPASVDSIPSSAMQEDHVSMGWAAGRKLRRSVDALAKVLAVELVTAVRGATLRAPLQPGPTGRHVAEALAAVGVACADAVASPGDSFLAPDLAAATEIVAKHSLHESLCSAGLFATVRQDGPEHN